MSVTSPANGSTVSAAFTVAGTASDNVSVASVQVAVDGGTLHAATGTASWTYAVSALAAGGHTITARATDSAGNIASASVSVSVSASITPPTSTVVWPRYDGTVIAGSYTLTGSSSDATYSIAREQWAVDGTVIASGTAATGLSYAWDTTNVAQGTHTLTYTTWNSAGASSSASRSVTVGTATIKRIGIILYQFNNQAPPMSVQQVTDWTFGTNGSVAGYYREESYGRLLLGGQYAASGDVFGFYTIPYAYPTTTTCDFTDWEASATQQASSAGVNLNGYDVLILTGAVPAGCGSGTATATQDRVPWTGFTFADQWIALTGHELGHSFGVWHHAASWTCTDGAGHPVQDSGTCTSSEYGDPYDIMGSGNVQHMNVYEKGQLGFFRSGNAITVTTPGTYTLAPSTAPSSGVQSIRIPRAYDASGNPTDFYYLEYRQPATYETPPANVTDYDGVLVREAPDYSQNGTVSNLVDTTPGSLNVPGLHDNFDAPLTPGRYFQDATAGITVKTLSAGSTGATIQVSFGTPQCVRIAPTISMSPASQSGPAGSTLYYSVTVSNNDSPACGASTLTVASSLPAGFAQSPATTTLSGMYPAGATSSWMIGVTSSATSISGSYSFTETATNGASSQSSSVSGAAGVG